MRRNVNYINCRDCKARSLSIFCELSLEEVDDVNLNKSCIVYKKKMAIFNQGTQPHGIYTINSGKVKIYQLTDSGKEQIVRMARPGDVLGYRALITGERYTCTAETIEESSICFIPKSIFFNMVEKNISISQRLLRLLSNDLRKAEHKITDLVEKPVRERLAEALLFLRETYGCEQDNETLNIVLTREEIANIVGTSTETAIRLLSEFKEDNIVEFIGKKIRIADIKGLTMIANVND